MPDAGDLQIIQGNLLAYQGQREVAASQQGAMRFCTFHQPMIGAPSGSYTPSDAGIVNGLATCKFPVAFTDPPMLDVSVSLGDQQPWYVGQHPEITACVMNWKRARDHWIYLGAEVVVTCRGVADEQVVIAHLHFSGPAVATPTSALQDVENTNKRVTAP